MAREGKMSPFNKMMIEAINKSGLEKDYKDYIFTVEVEVLRDVDSDSVDYELNLCNLKDKFTITGTEQSISSLLFNPSVIEHPHALTSKIKQDVYGKPIYTILSCKVEK